MIDFPIQGFDDTDAPGDYVIPVSSAAPGAGRDRF